MKQFVFLAFTALIFIGTGCSKYDDGPLISFRSKQNRLVNTWAYKLVLRNGVNVNNSMVAGTANYTQSSIGFNDSGRFSEIYTIDEVAKQLDGSWSFDEDKAILILEYDNGQDDRNLRLNKLKNEELWFEESFGDNLIEYQLIPND